jgi:caa(3)-type oxidase subunit IV
MSHQPKDYVKIWAILLVLFFISVTGPMLGIQVVTLITAFGIAIVKAWLVASKFMHLNIEKKYVTMLLFTMIAMVLLFFAGTAPDVMSHDGTNWSNNAAKAETARAMEVTAHSSSHH